MKIQGNVVLIKPDKLPERTPTGQLIVPKNSREMLPEWGTVVDIGPECTDTKIGDKVNFPRKLASVIVIEGEDHYLLNEHRLFFNKEKEVTYTLNCDTCGKPFQSNEAFPKPQICPTCYF